MSNELKSSNLEVCQYCKLPVDAQWDHATGLDCLDAMTEDRDKLHAALVAIRDGQIIQGMSPALLAEKVLRGAPAPEPRDGV